jgi:hypothetical protein
VRIIQTHPAKEKQIENARSNIFDSSNRMEMKNIKQAAILFLGVVVGIVCGMVMHLTLIQEFYKSSH